MTAPISLTPQQLSELVSQAVREALAEPDRARQNDAAQGTISEKSIEAICDGTTEANPMCRVYGPYQKRNKYQIKVIDSETGKVQAHTFDTQAEAEAAIPRLRGTYRRPAGVPMTEALSAYAAYLATERQNRPSTVETTIGRIKALFGGVGETMTDEITPSDVRKAWDRVRASPVSKAGKLPSTDTLVGTLKQSRTFATWLAEKGWAKRADLFDGIKILGKRHKGKPQLRIDDAAKYEAKGLELAELGDVGAIAALVPLYMGTRAGEVVGRKVRDLDARGTVLVIEGAKTDKGNRELDLDPVLTPFLLRLARGKQPDDPLFTGATKHAKHSLEDLADPVAWLRRQVARLCKLAGVPVVGPHGLRGTYATMAVLQARRHRQTLTDVAEDLGHTSTTVTREHYLAPGALEKAQAADAAAFRAHMGRLGQA